MGIIINQTTKLCEPQRRPVLRDLIKGDVFKFIECPSWEDCFRMVVSDNKYARLTGRDAGDIVEIIYAIDYPVQTYNLYSKSEKIGP